MKYWEAAHSPLHNSFLDSTIRIPNIVAILIGRLRAVLPVAHLNVGPQTTMKATSLVVLLSALTSLLIGAARPPSTRPAVSPPPGAIPKLNVDASNITVFFAKGISTNELSAGRTNAKPSPYTTNHNRALLTLVDVAVEAVLRTGRKVPQTTRVGCNIALDTGTLVVLLSTISTNGTYWVVFDSGGQIVRLGGALGMHGEGAWKE